MFQSKIRIYIREILIKMKAEICGYALKFNNYYRTYDDILKDYVFERILPEALTQEFINTQKVRCKLQHIDNYYLASNYIGKEVIKTRDSQGNERIQLESSYIGDGKLYLRVDDIGLWYSFNVDENNPLHIATVKMINSGVLNGSSHGRGVWKEDNKIENIKGVNYRTILKIDKLFDVSPVTRGSNPLTTLELRYEDKELKEFYLKRQAELKEREFKKYYKELCEKYSPTKNYH